MPKINDYSSPELNATQGRMQSSAGLRSDGSFGRAVQAFGSDVKQLGREMYNRQAQEETSDLNAKFSDARAEWAASVEEETRNGTIDTGKMKAKLQESINSMDKDIETAEGRKMFDSQASRLMLSTTKASMRGEAIVIGAKAQANWQSSLAARSSALNTDPDSFADDHDAMIESIDAQVASGAMPAALAEKFKLDTGKELAKSAVRGWANLSPELAQKKLNAGQFDKYFDGDTKAQMQGYINQMQSAKETEERRAVIAQEKAEKKTGEAWQNEHLSKLVSGELKTSDIVNSNALTYQQKVDTLKLADWASRERTQTDQSVENELFRRINLPDGDPNQINNMSQLVPFVGKGITPEGVQKLNHWIDDTPEGSKKKSNRKGVMDYARARLVKKDTFGMSDPKGELLLNQFTSDLQEAESALMAEGKSTAELYNPHSPNYFGLQADKYKRSSRDIMKDTVQEMRKASIKNQVDFDKPKAAVMPRKEGETLENWLIRRRTGG